MINNQKEISSNSNLLDVENMFKEFNTLRPEKSGKGRPITKSKSVYCMPCPIPIDNCICKYYEYPHATRKGLLVKHRNFSIACPIF